MTDNRRKRSSSNKRKASTGLAITGLRTRFGAGLAITCSGTHFGAGLTITCSGTRFGAGLAIFGSIDEPHNELRETRALRIDDPELKLRRACAFTRPSASVLRDARRTPIPCSHEGSRIVDPTIPDPAAAARRLSAVWPNRRGILCSEREARPSGMRSTRMGRPATAAKGCSFAHA